VFGATRTTVSASITPCLDRYIKIAAIPQGGYLFHARNNKFEVVKPAAWTLRVKAVFKRHGGTALCPKDTRASFITFLRSGDHDDEAVKAAAVAMRHSSKTQASAAYDKGASDKRISAAMKVAHEYSAKFNASSGASSSSSK
jgi:integrase